MSGHGRGTAEGSLTRDLVYLGPDQQDRRPVVPTSMSKRHPVVAVTGSSEPEPAPSSALGIFAQEGIRLQWWGRQLSPLRADADEEPMADALAAGKNFPPYGLTNLFGKLEELFHTMARPAPARSVITSTAPKRLLSTTHVWASISSPVSSRHGRTSRPGLMCSSMKACTAV